MVVAVGSAPIHAPTPEVPVLAVLKSNDALYQIVFLLHILSAIVAFAPAFSWPFVNLQMRKRGSSVPSDVAGQVAVNDAVVHGPALALAGAFGIIMIALSDGIYEFSQLWISLAFLVWFAMLGVLYGLLVPAGRQAAVDGPDSPSAKRVSMAGGIMHLLIVVMLVVMIWKPGF